MGFQWKWVLSWKKYGYEYGYGFLKSIPDYAPDLVVKGDKKSKIC